ncbi:MAG TPA: tetratricopeptide repeat protein, partial [Pyrinomonadaceae bacterium]|nr:tetratricopeptide repeat protein [Pyrinomonadaceae bacterium]
NQIKPNDNSILVMLGNVNFDARKWEDAQKWYEKALALKKDDIAVRTDLGITFVERSTPDYDRAIKEFQTSLTIDPKHEPTLYNLALANYKKGNIQEAQAIRAKLASNAELSKKLDALFASN